MTYFAQIKCLGHVHTQPAWYNQHSAKTSIRTLQALGNKFNLDQMLPMYTLHDRCCPNLVFGPCAHSACMVQPTFCNDQPKTLPGPVTKVLTHITIFLNLTTVHEVQLLQLCPNLIFGPNESSENPEQKILSFKILQYV